MSPLDSILEITVLNVLTWEGKLGLSTNPGIVKKLYLNESLLDNNAILVA